MSTAHHPVADARPWLDGIDVIGIDGDDTLWHSERHFSVTEERFADLLAPWCEGDDLGARLLSTERANLAVFGYGVKSFVISMIETAISVSGGEIGVEAIEAIIGWGKELHSHPTEVLTGVVDALDSVRHRRLVLVTKGDLFHQESKVAASGLAERFEAIEIVSEKDPATYADVVARLDIDPSAFCMIGNSVRSDVLPVVEIGGRGVHVPHDITWGHEVTGDEPDDSTWWRVATLGAALG